MSTAILTTTTHVPQLLRGYARNARCFGHEDVEFIVAGDRKSPQATGGLCASMSREFGLAFTFLDVEAQTDYLAHFPRLNRILPWGPQQHRNVGLLHALKQGHEFILNIEDDIFLLPGSDFIGEHTTGLGVVAAQKVVSSSSGWFNCIDMMQTNCGTVYPRGFPLHQRGTETDLADLDQTGCPVVNVGLSIGGLDLDALTPLYFPAETRLPLTDNYLTLAPGTWCPINTRNTAFHRSAALAAFMVATGYELDGLKISRYSDIWTSWLLQTVVDHMGDAVRFGKPVVRQDRRAHHPCSDFHDELPGMELNETLIAACRSARLTGRTYLESYAELARHLEDELSSHPQGPFFRYLTDQMNTWVEACDRIGCADLEAAAA